MPRAYLAVPVLCATVILAPLVRPAAADPPEVFADQSFDEALETTAGGERLLLVDATAVWCKPCKQMDRTTWVDPDVVAWIGEKALAIQVDVDRDKAVAKTLRIAAMPTVIAFRGGEELDRVVGYQSAEALLGWLDGVLQGRRAIDAVREAAAEGGPDGKVDVQARLELARTLVQQDELDEAVEAYTWLWENMLDHEPGMYGVRLSFMASDMTRLSRRHPPALEAFKALRDRALAAVKKIANEPPRDADRHQADYRTVVDWVHLNEIVGEEDLTLEWYGKVRDDPARSRALELIGNEIFDLLVRKHRWKEAGAVIRDPVTTTGRRLETLDLHAMGDLPEEHRALMRSQMLEHTRQRLGQVYAALLAAGRENDAGRVARLVIEAIDTPDTRFALIEAALLAASPRAVHLNWLDEAAEQNETAPDLRERLTRALEL